MIGHIHKSLVVKSWYIKGDIKTLIKKMVSVGGETLETGNQ